MLIRTPTPQTLTFPLGQMSQTIQSLAIRLATVGALLLMVAGCGQNFEQEDHRLAYHASSRQLTPGPYAIFKGVHPSCSEHSRCRTHRHKDQVFSLWHAGSAEKQQRIAGQWASRHTMAAFSFQQQSQLDGFLDELAGMVRSAVNVFTGDPGAQLVLVQGTDPRYMQTSHVRLYASLELCVAALQSGNWIKTDMGQQTGSRDRYPGQEVNCSMQSCACIENEWAEE